MVVRPFASQPVRVAQLLDLSQPGLKCADFGCGTGGLVAELRKRYPTWFVVGLDRSKAALEFARQNYGFDFICGDVQQPPFKAALFDVIFAVDVMYHRDVQPERMLGGSVPHSSPVAS